MTVTLVRLVFPMAGLLVVGAWGLGVLNSHRRFFLPYAAPVLWNLVQIGVVLVVGGALLVRGERLAMALTLGALAGAALQLGVLLHGARRLLGTLRPRLELANRHLREAVRRLPSVLLGRGVVQISGYVDTLLVSFLGTGANAIFGYAQMLYLLPMSVLGTGEAAVSLTEMSHDAVERDEARRNETLRSRLGSALSRTTALSIPAMVGLVLFGREAVTLLLETGAFDRASSVAVAQALAIFGPGLLANASGRVFATSLYALGDTRRPARYAVARVVTSTGISLALMGPFGVVGVVAGSTIAAWVEAALLAAAVRRTIGAMGLAQLQLGRLLGLLAACVAIPFGLRWALPPGFAGGLLGAAVILTALGAVFALLAPWLGLFNLGALVRRRR
jgi:putative peptidoglycan lipid II flippase